MTRTSSAGLSLCLLAIACTPAPKEPVATVAVVEPSTPPVEPAKAEPKVEPKVEPKAEPNVEPKIAPTTPPPVEVAPAVAAAPVESLGGIALGIPLADLQRKYPGGSNDLPPLEDTGTPTLFGGRDLPPADERWLWGYDKAGLHAIVAGPTDKGPWRVVHLTATSKSKHKTKKGIGVRSTIAQVRTAYPSAVFDREDSAIIALSATERLEILFEDGRAIHVVLASPPDDD